MLHELLPQSTEYLQAVLDQYSISYRPFTKEDSPDTRARLHSIWISRRPFLLQDQSRFRLLAL
jgi:hypothetical protein